MRFGLTAWIARRYFFSRSKTRFLPFLTAIAIGGVAVGTCAMVVILSIMNGFREELESRLLGFNAHITITEKGQGGSIAPDRVRELIGPDRVRDIAPFVEGEVIVEARLGEELFAQGARIRGVDPRALGMMREVDYYLAPGVSMTHALAKPSRPGSMPGIILGRDILSQLNVHPDFLDIVEAIAPLADVGPTGELEPRLKRFVLVGSFTSNVYEYDTLYALVNIDEAVSLLGMQASKGWQVRVDDSQGVPEMLAGLKSALGAEAEVEGWHERNKKLFAALKLERIAMGGVMALVILIASFSVIGVVMMVVSSKRKDIAVLQSMGMRNRLLRAVFLHQGMWIGIVGSLVGCVIGISICFMLMRWPIHLPQSYYVEILQVAITPWWVASIAVLGVVLAMVSSIYPVSTAMRDDPSTVLRYE